MLAGPDGRYDARAPRGLTAYLVGQFFGLLAVTNLLLFGQSQFSLLEKLALAIFIAWSSANVGALFEARPWVFLGELMRLAAVPVLAFLLVAGRVGSLTALLAIAVAVLVAGGNAAIFLRFRRALSTGAAEMG